MLGRTTVPWERTTILRTEGVSCHLTCVQRRLWQASLSLLAAALRVSLPLLQAGKAGNFRSVLSLQSSSSLSALRGGPQSGCSAFLIWTSSEQPDRMMSHHKCRDCCLKRASINPSRRQLITCLMTVFLSVFLCLHLCREGHRKRGRDDY